jgi:hypothetical protein
MLNQPFIVGLSGGAIANVRTEGQLPRIIHSVFPFGHYGVKFNRETLAVIDEGYEHRESISKLNNAPVSTNIFFDEEYAPISAILFSYSDVCNTPIIPGADFVLCHNPLAKNPLPRSWLRIGREYWAENDRLEMKNWNEPGWGSPRSFDMS